MVCDKRYQFDTRKQAKAFVRRRGLVGNRVYRCDECGLFHSTRASAEVTRWYRERKGRRG